MEKQSEEELVAKELTPKPTNKFIRKDLLSD